MCKTLRHALICAKSSRNEQTISSTVCLVMDPYEVSRTPAAPLMTRVQYHYYKLFILRL